ncbi:hypothetical protein [uncultured Agrococcus sp.]|uniref:hypothetical protein n=1 Tax=uncultured Agrococcus sp. TaxID=382258 RepID=UPI0025D23392|nr:hypothetical protein [uncultured Agrococcus sp.]
MSVVLRAAGFTFRVQWSEHEQDYIGTVRELPRLRVFYGNQDAALTGILRRTVRELGGEDASESDLERARLLRDTLAEIESSPN